MMLGPTSTNLQGMFGKKILKTHFFVCLYPLVSGTHAGNCWIGKGESGKAEGRKNEQFMAWEQWNFQGNGEENFSTIY